jgi:hypothetical protein
MTSKRIAMTSIRLTEHIADAEGDITSGVEDLAVATAAGMAMAMAIIVALTKEAHGAIPIEVREE